MKTIKEYLNYIQEANTNNIADIKGYIYYITGSGSLSKVKKYGITSPIWRYNHDMDFFMDTTYKLYHKKTKDDLKLDRDPTAKEVLHYIDSLYLLSGRSILFSFIPYNMYHPSYIKMIGTRGGVGNNTNKILQCKISIKKANLLKHDPLIAGPGKKFKFSNWDHIQSDDFLQKVLNFCSNPSKNLYNTSYNNFPHLRLYAHYIPASNLEHIKIFNKKG